MELKKYDGKRVRITDVDGKKFEGIAEYLNEEFCMHELGREEEGLEIVNFTFFKGDIKEIESLEESGYSSPYGEIEIENLLDGFDSIYDELFCEEDEHVCRMLACLNDRMPDLSDEVADAVRELLKTDISPQCKLLANQLLEKQQQKPKGNIKNTNSTDKEKENSKNNKSNKNKNNKNPGFIKDLCGDPKTHLGVTVISLVALALAAGLFYICFAINFDYLTAPYKVDVDATLVNIRETEKEDWEYVGKKEEGQRPEDRETRITHYTLYTLKWEYELNGEKQIRENSEKYSTGHKVGDTTTFKLYSEDGVEYHHSSIGVISWLLLGVSGIFGLICLFVFITTQVYYIKNHKGKGKKKRKKKR